MAKKPEYGNITRHLLEGSNDTAVIKKVDPEGGKLVTRDESSTKKGLKPGETRTTFIIDEAVLNDFKLVAYWERSAIKDLLHDAMQDVVTAYIKKHGPLKPRKPRRK